MSDMSESDIENNYECNDEVYKNNNCCTLLMRLLDNIELFMIYSKMDDFKVNINEQNRDGDTVLITACEQDIDVSIFDILLENGADVNFTNKYGKSALSILCNCYDDSNKNRFTIIKKLLKYDVNINHQDNNGHTALYNLCGLTDITLDEFNFLLANGADFNIKTKDNMTILMNMCDNDVDDINIDIMRKIIKILDEKKALYINFQTNKYKKTALMMTGNMFEISALLININVLMSLN